MQPQGPAHPSASQREHTQEAQLQYLSSASLPGTLLLPHQVGDQNKTRPHLAHQYFLRCWPSLGEGVSAQAIGLNSLATDF